MSRFYLWLFKRVIRLARIRSTEVMMRTRYNQYLYVDYHGDLYRIMPTGTPGNPIEVQIVEKAWWG